MWRAQTFKNAKKELLEHEDKVKLSFDKKKVRNTLLQNIYITIQICGL